MSECPQEPTDEDSPEERAMDALIALALHPRSEELTPLVAKKLDEIESDLADLRAKGWKIEPHGIGWDYCHQDYDGSPDSRDDRCGWGALADCIAEMKELDERREEGQP